MAGSADDFDVMAELLGSEEQYAISRGTGEKRPNGLSLDALRAFIQACGGRAKLENLTTNEVKLNFLLPMTLEQRVSYSDLLLQRGDPGAREANRFISHAYDYKFLHVIDAIEAKEGRGSRCEPLFYYFDLLVENQHSQSAVVAPENLMAIFGGGVRSIGYTLLVLEWDNPLPFVRAWCLLEIGTSLLHGGVLEVIMPPQSAAKFAASLAASEAIVGEHPFAALNRQLCVDCKRATAREPKDLSMIQDFIRNSFGRDQDADRGFSLLNSMVRTRLKSWMERECHSTFSQQPWSDAAANNMAMVYLLQPHSDGSTREAVRLLHAVVNKVDCGEQPQSRGYFCALVNLAELHEAQGFLEEAYGAFARGTRAFAKGQGLFEASERELIGFRLLRGLKSCEAHSLLRMHSLGAARECFQEAYSFCVHLPGWCRDEVEEPLRISLVSLLPHVHPWGQLPLALGHHVCTTKARVCSACEDPVVPGAEVLMCAPFGFSLCTKCRLIAISRLNLDSLLIQ